MAEKERNEPLTFEQAARLDPELALPRLRGPHGVLLDPAQTGWLFVSLGGQGSIPREQGLAIVAHDPLKVVTELDTGIGAGRVATSPTGHRAAVTAYLDRSITIVEPQPEP